MTVTDLRPVAVASVQGTLALDLTAHQDPPEEVPAGAGSSCDVVDIGRAARREFDRLSGRIVQAVVEIVGGDRPVTQVLRWTTPDVYQDLGRRAHLVAQAVGRRPGPGRRPGHPTAGGRRAHLLRRRRRGRGQRPRAVRAALAGRRGALRAAPRPVGVLRPGVRLGALTVWCCVSHAHREQPWRDDDVRSRPRPAADRQPDLRRHRQHRRHGRPRGRGDRRGRRRARPVRRRPAARGTPWCSATTTHRTPRPCCARRSPRTRRTSR